MLSLPSLQSEYTLCFSRDPALDLPDPIDIDRDKATEEEIAAADAIEKERNAKLKIARETGNWPTKGGQQLTRFKFRQVHGHLMTWWSGQLQRENLSMLEGFELMFRLALVSVENMGSFEIKHDPSKPDQGKPQLISLKTLNSLYSIGQDTAGSASLGRDLVMELGAAVAHRAIEGCPPLR
jgi:hypothetical protein